MRRFTRLFNELDATTRSAEKLRALERYFGQAASVDDDGAHEAGTHDADAHDEAPSPADAAWAVAIFTGHRLKRAVSYRTLRRWVGEASGEPDWLVAECHRVAGDLSETLALLLPPADERRDPPPLAEMIERSIIPLRALDEPGQRRVMEEAWSMLDTRERFVFHKLLSGSFRVGVQKRTIVRALANVAEVDPAVMAHRLSGSFEPTAEAFLDLLGPEAEGGDPARPYPFFLASPVEDAVAKQKRDAGEVNAATIAAALGDVAGWIAEWKWDGIRAQLIHRRDPLAREADAPADRFVTSLWSRGDEPVMRAFPEIVGAARSLPQPAVIDGEIVAWDPYADRPMPFTALQRRLNRKSREPMLFEDVPVRFLAYDVLELAGDDVRALPTNERRARLATLLNRSDEPVLRLSREIDAASWGELESVRARSRDERTEGLMLKRRDAPYRVGRTRGDWWKWKIEPLTIDAVMIYAEPGHGRRAGLHTDYTFGVWTARPSDGTDAELVPITKAYSGLTDKEIARVDRFVRRNTTERHGPIRGVTPEMVFEIAFEGIQASDRHRSGIALRFPRMKRIRDDKTPEEADTLEHVRTLLHTYGAPA
jgi:DNA ligase-1